MTHDEIANFERHPYSRDAVQLRRWDDLAKIPSHATPTLLHFAKYMFQVAAPDEPE